MSKITIDIKANYIDIYYESESNNIQYPIAMFKDDIATIEESTNKIVIKLVVALIYNIGNALMQKCSNACL